MKESILNHKKLLIVDDEEDVLFIAEEEIRQSCPDCKVDKAETYEDAARLLESKEYDLVILDIMGVRGFDLLEIAVTRKFKVAMLTAHALSSDALKKAHDMGAWAYLPKGKLGELVPFLENILLKDYKAGWEGLIGELEDYFNKTLEPGWKKNAGVEFWY
jgi:DNA-binding response OmpR family regulator